MKELFTSTKKTLEDGSDIMLVSIFAASGSAPRGAGAKMLMSEAGRISGTIGGGSVEHEAVRHALALLGKKSGDTQSFRLAPNKVKDLGMVCGGEVSVCFQYITAGDRGFCDLCATALMKLDGGEVSWLVTAINGPESAQSGIFSEKDGWIGISATEGLNFTDIPHTQKISGSEYLVEPLVRAGTVYIFGGGHVAQALVPVAAKVGFRCVVFDDRAEFTNRSLFPDAAGVQRISFEKIADAVTVTDKDYIVIMTRGHQYDSQLQAQAMRTGARYIGVMGSRHKIAHVSAQMRELGFTDADLARIKTPIGVDISAETPEEIAVSIAAELIMVRAAAISR